MGLSLLRRRRRKAEPCARGQGSLRIADVLREPEEDEPCSCEDGNGGRRGWKASSPIWACSRFAVSVQKTATFLGREEKGRKLGCWVFMGWKGKVETIEDVGKVEASSSFSSHSLEKALAEVEEGVEGSVVIERGEECLVQGKEVTEIQGSQSGSGRGPEEASFALGLGVGLVYLLARSKSHFEKMLEMRKEVEAILDEVKDLAVHKKDLTRESVDSKKHLAVGGSDSSGDEKLSHLTNKSLPRDRSPSFHMTESPEEHEEDSSGSPGHLLDVDQLQEEFESEIELLQNELDCSHNEYVVCDTKMTDQNTDVSEGSLAGSESDLTVEETGEQNADDSCEFGVCPRELERRLHELLQSRQQERIKELEFALQRAEKKLREKEMEICLWRETTQLNLCHNSKNKSSRLHQV